MLSLANQGFSASSRLRNSREFSRVWREGRRCHTQHLTVIVCPSVNEEQSLPRLGITVSRKVGNAVCRNRIKRWVREYFRCCSLNLATAVDLSVIAKPGTARLVHCELDLELREAFRRLHLHVDA